MKISLGFGTQPPHSVAAARACLTVNLLGLPGLGSWVAGQRIGICQMILSLMGFGLTVFWFVSTLMLWLRAGEIPLDGGSQLLIGLAGVGIFTLAWLWSLETGLRILRQARRNSP